MDETAISNKAVQEKTGKTWEEWFEILDTAGANSLSHKEIVSFLKASLLADSWWQQSVTVAYEKARGLRKKHEMPDGFQISKSITIRAQTEAVYAAWVNDLDRARWLADSAITIRKANHNKSLRVTWVDGKMIMDVFFYPKADRTQVTLNHGKIASEDEAAKMKIFWGKQLAKLKALMES